MTISFPASGRAFGFAAVLLLAVPGAALAQPDTSPGTNSAVPMVQRLWAERMGEVDPGLYSAGDTGNFIIAPYSRDRCLLRFQNGAETFVLTIEHSSLGAKILKYDTGTTAIRVSVWGGMTLYTRDAPGGIPATRQGDAPAAPDAAVSQPELQTALGDEASHLVYVQRIGLKFSADPSVLGADPETRGRAFDALTNAGLGIERFLDGAPGARPLMVRRINAVKVTEGAKPTLVIVGQTLLISFVPGEGHEGHPSSLAVQQELGKLLAVSPASVATK